MILDKKTMKRKLNNTSRKEDILRLRAIGKTYNEIQKELGFVVWSRHRRRFFAF